MTGKLLVHCSQDKWHDQKLEVAKVTMEGCLLYVLLPHPNLMVPRPYMYFGEKFISMQLIHRIINSGNWVPILYCLLIQRSVTNTHPKCPILILHQNHRRSRGTRACYNEDQLKQILDVLLNFILESLWILIGVDFYWRCTSFQLSHVFNAMVRWPAM